MAPPSDVVPSQSGGPWLLLSQDLACAKSPPAHPAVPLGTASCGCVEPTTMRAGLQYLPTSNPVRWTWPFWRTARCPWSAWPQGCLLPVSQSSPSALAHIPLGLSLGPLGERSGSIAPYSSAPCFPPDIAWYKGHEQLLAGPNWTLSRDGKRLEIQRAQLSDAGSYRCVVSNVVGVTELWYSLQVIGESTVGRTAGPLVLVWVQWGHPSPQDMSLEDGFSRAPVL